jgi:membrane protein implicated in regulation of membrane protease activity
VGSTRSVRDSFYAFYDAHVGEVIAASVVRALGLLAVGWMLTFLAAATRARRPELVRAATWLPVVGAVLQGVATLMGTFASASGVANYLDGPRTVDSAADVTSSSVLVASSFIGLVGQFALAAAFVLICLNAMRAGLLTRFMGVLGIIVGVTNIIPIGPLPIVQTFWLVAVGVLLFGVWPGAGVPPAWRTGRAEPWPSASEQAERRRAAAERRVGGRVAPEAAAPTEAAAPPSMAGAARRKRKRRK